VTLDQIVDELERAFAHPLGPIGRMYEEEAKIGALPLTGELLAAIMPAAEWERGVITRQGDEIRLVAILAKQPGNGAFKRMLAAIKAAGLRPVIVSPVGPVMPTLMRKWRWRRTIVGLDFGRYEEWRPPL